MRLRKKEIKMKGNRELFEKLPDIKAILQSGFQFNEELNQYYHLDHTSHRLNYAFIMGAWLGWQASAQREGYKLVPVEPSADLVNHGHQVFLGHFNEGGQTGVRSLYFAYKAMLEAVENKG